MVDDPYWPRASEWLAGADPEPALQVAGVPNSAASISGSDAWRAPRELRTVLDRFSTYHGERDVDLETLPVADLGDWDVRALDPHALIDAVDALARALPPEPVHLFLGGDNAITRPLARATADRDLDRLGVLTFDAHHDVRVTDPVPTNGSPIRGLIEDGVAGEAIVQVGIHSFANSRAYRRYGEQHGIRVITMRQIDREGITVAVDTALQHLADRVDHIHVDFDIDVLDRSHAPACPGARPGGMTPRQLARAAYHVGLHEKVTSADIVEVDPARDLHEVTLMNAATVLLSFAAGLARRLQRPAVSGPRPPRHP